MQIRLKSVMQCSGICDCRALRKYLLEIAKQNPNVLKEADVTS